MIKFRSAAWAIEIRKREAIILAQETTSNKFDEMEMGSHFEPRETLIGHVTTLAFLKTRFYLSDVKIHENDPEYDSFRGCAKPWGLEHVGCPMLGGHFAAEKYSNLIT